MSTPSPLHAALRVVATGADLDADAMAAAMGEVMDGAADPLHLAAFLTGLRVKGETVDEVLGAVRTMRRRATAIEPRQRRLLDTCGTGGDGAGTFNISTAVAFVCAAAGVTVAKHGNRAISSRVGSADVLEALGMRLDLDPDAVTRCVDEVGIGFLYAPHHHGALRHAGPVRRTLGFRTLLNILGPMTNPAGATHQLIGVFDGGRCGLVAEVLGRLGSRRALVVHGCDGLDEITLAGPTHAALWDGAAVTEMTLDPADHGVARADASALAGGDAATNASIVREVLGGCDDARADIVRANAGAALWIAGEAPDFGAGIALATEVLRSGAALGKLDALATLTRSLAPA